MKQGTVSVLIGCHSPVHSLLVLLSWRKLYNEWPAWWQVGCIFLHDIGHWGKDYLSNDDEKARHWKLGARLAYYMFGHKGWNSCAGHCDGVMGKWRSRLYYADKYSWYIAPYWWLYWNNIVEPKLKCGMKNRDAVIDFQKSVKWSIECGLFRQTHSFYEERKSHGTNRIAR